MRRSHVSYATPHTHDKQAYSPITMRGLRNHLINDHDKGGYAITTTDFNVLVKLHMNAHGGDAPAYEEIPMNSTEF